MTGVKKSERNAEILLLVLQIETLLAWFPPDALF